MPSKTSHNPPPSDDEKKRREAAKQRLLGQIERGRKFVEENKEIIAPIAVGLGVMLKRFFAKRAEQKKQTSFERAQEQMPEADEAPPVF